MTQNNAPSLCGTPSLAEALEKLLPDLRGFAWSLCRDRTLADDLVQDACMKAWSASDSLKPDADIKPWVCQILRNIWRQHRRRAWRTQLVDSEEIERSLISESNAEARADSLKATDVIYSLPEHHRDAVILVLAMGMTHTEAAQVLDCSVGTVKSRLSRARKAVHDSLEYGLKKYPNKDDIYTPKHSGLETMIESAHLLIGRSTKAA